MKRMAIVLALLAIGFFPLAATMSQAADTGSHESHHAGVIPPAYTGNRFCMSGSTMMDGGMMSGMMTGGMMSGMVTGGTRHAGNAKTSPDCGMSETDCLANHSALCGHDRAAESRTRECGA